MPNEDGSADLVHVLGVAKNIGELITEPTIVIDKSTVPVGAADKVRAVIQEELDRRGVDVTFDVVSNPEFLKEGTAIDELSSHLGTGANGFVGNALCRNSYMWPAMGRFDCKESLDKLN